MAVHPVKDRQQTKVLTQHTDCSPTRQRSPPQSRQVPGSPKFRTRLHPAEKTPISPRFSES
ncbi:MAG TPA: hypothetical protein DC058_05305 [Planctomycetaceae bacterium]|nr:hypothetical protein [Planctomycetaceae bacterium]HBC60622.1 hypothetical protein [Planctomycetaceae bacterium]